MSDLFKGPFSSPSDALKIKARPTEHEALIRRQGQYVRIISAKKCPCISNGRVNLHCNICRGFGFIFEYQTNALVMDENSIHYGTYDVFPKAAPLTKVIAVQRVLHESQHGNVDYPIESFNETKIKLSGPFPPKRHETLRVTYEYSLLKTVTNENCTHDGGYAITTTGTKTKMPDSANPFNIHGDIIEVTRVFNFTKTETYSVKNFYKQTIEIDDVDGTVTAPEASDVLQVDYKFLDPARIGTGRVDIENAIQKWGEDIKEGDIEGMIPGYFYVAKGDIITLLSPRLKMTEVIQRGSGLKDELPQFDVVEVIGNIMDEDGNEYNSTKFSLREYNNLIWVSGQGPAQGKKYTVSFLYRPTYRVYKQDINTMTNEDKRFPQQVLLRYMNRFNKKELLRF